MIESSLLCMALVVFHEARGEPIKAQYAVLEVVHNRTKSGKFPDTPCGVVKQPNQFSWFKNHGSLKPPKYEIDSWNNSLKVAKDFQTKKTNYTKGSVFFNTRALGVRYKTKTTPCIISNHIFY